jgi:hypothetical protein
METQIWRLWTSIHDSGHAKRMHPTDGYWQNNTEICLRQTYLVRFYDRSDWKDSFQSNRKGGLFWHTDGSTTNTDTRAGVYWWFLALISVRGWVNSKATAQLEGLGQLKNPMTSSGIESMTFLLASTVFQPTTLHNEFWLKEINYIITVMLFTWVIIFTFIWLLLQRTCYSSI